MEELAREEPVSVSPSASRGHRSAEQRRSQFQVSGGSRATGSWTSGSGSNPIHFELLELEDAEILVEDERPILPGVPIRAASLAALVRLCVQSFKPVGEIREEFTSFPRVLFLMHPWFTCSPELMSLLVVHYNSATTMAPCFRDPCCLHNSIVSCPTERYRASVINAVRYWLSNFPIHFGLDVRLQGLMKDFISSVEASGNSLRAEMLSLSSLPSYDWIRNVSLRDSETCRPCRKVSLIFNHLEPDELAHHLTFLEHKIMRRITFEDFKNYAETGTLEENAKLERSVSLFNGLSQWIQCVVLSRPTPNQRADVIVKFVQVAKNLRRLQNFNSLMGVVGSLSHSALARLSKTMDCVPVEERKALAELTTLVSSASNFSLYRKALSDSKGFKIPILGVHLKDLICLHTALPDFAEKGLINFRKMTQLSQIFVVLQDLQQSMPPAQANTDLLNTLRVSLDLAYSEDEIYELSLSREPKTATSISPTKSEITERQVASMVDAVFRSFDSNHDGFISKEEFQAILTNFPSIDAFFVLDENRDGMISKLEMERYLRNRKKTGSRHDFHETTYFKPTFCIHCSGLLWGLIRQGYKCRNCGANAHKHCKDYMLHECKMGQLLFFPASEPQTKRRGFRRRKKSSSQSEAGGSPPSPKLFNSLEQLSLSMEAADSPRAGCSHDLLSDTHSGRGHAGSTTTPKACRRFSVLGTSGRASLSVPNSPKLGLPHFSLPWSPCRSLFQSSPPVNQVQSSVSSSSSSTSAIQHGHQTLLEDTSTSRIPASSSGTIPVSPQKRPIGGVH